MEGVGARLGRSSSRYGTTTVFTGPVRKWKKDWVPITPPSSSSSNNSNNQNQNQNHHQNLQSSSSSSLANGASSLNGNNNNGSVSHLRLYKWTPVSQSANKENPNSNNPNNTDDDSPSKENSKDDNVSEEPPKKKFKYIPIAVLEEQKKEDETEENTDDETKAIDDDINTTEQTSKSDGHGEKPDINDMPMEENQDSEEDNQTAPGRQDLNESLDLSLGLTSHEGEHDSDSKMDPAKDE